jgi:formylglycine-generating enzyme required for sulfatase activity
MRPAIFLICVVALLMSVVGCGGNGSFNSAAKTTGDDTFVVDLTISRVLPQGDEPAVGSATRLMFRRVPADRVVIGRYPKDKWAEPDERKDENEPAIRLGEYFIATTELTQEQWGTLAQGIAPVAPWLALDETTGVTPARLLGHTRPAVGVTRIEIESVCSKRSPPGWRLRLPTPAEWEHAALASATTRFSWGDAQGDEEVKRHANVWLLNEPSLISSQDVGMRLPNAFGLHDMHGNVWEMTAGVSGPTYACGGAWDQPVLQARASNRLTIPADAGLPTVGVRLVLVRE